MRSALMEGAASTDHQSRSVTEFKVSISVNYNIHTSFNVPLYISPYYCAVTPLSLTCEVDGIIGEG